MNLNWLNDLEVSWRDRIAQERVPHAVILAGKPGVGKRALAAWIALQKLRPQQAPGHVQHPSEPAQHADLHWVAPPDDKHTIGIDQIRALVNEFSMTSYEGSGKVGVIEPAAMVLEVAATR